MQSATRFMQQAQLFENAGQGDCQQQQKSSCVVILFCLAEANEIIDRLCAGFDIYPGIGSGADGGLQNSNRRRVTAQSQDNEKKDEDDVAHLKAPGQTTGKTTGDNS